MTRLLAPPPKVGREDGAGLVDDEDVRLALVGAQLVHLLLEGRDVGGEQLVGQPETPDARVVAVEAALEVAGDRGEPPVAAGPHADRVQLERGHAVVVHELPELRQVLHERRDDLARRADVGERVGDDEGLQAGQRLEGDGGDVGLRQLLDIDASAMGQRHGRRAEMRVVGDGEIDLVLGGNAGLEGDAIRLGIGVAVAVLGEVEPLLFGQRGLEVAGLADEPGLALLADAAAEDRLDEDQAVAGDQVLDRVFAGVGPEHLGRGEVDVAEQPRSVEHSVELHGRSPQ